MHHTQATHALSVRQADELGQGHTGFVAAQAMQIDLALDRPIAFAQFMDHVAPNARAAKTQRVVGVEQSAGVELVAQAIAQHGFVVLLALVRNRGGAGSVQIDLVVHRQALHGPHGTHKQVAFGLALTRGQRLGSRLRLGQRVGLGQLLAHFLQVLQRIDFHRRSSGLGMGAYSAHKKDRRRVTRPGCASSRRS